MSEPDQNAQPVDPAGTAGDDAAANSSESSAAVHVGDGELSDTGVGLGVGEPNTFEPEEAAPAPDTQAT